MLSKKRSRCSDTQERSNDKEENKYKLVPDSSSKYKVECVIILKLYTSITPCNDEVDSNEEKCICCPPQPSDEMFCEQEIVPQIFLSAVENKVQLSELVVALKKFGFPLTASIIYAYDADSDEYVKCGSDPFEPNIMVSYLGDSNIIRLKCYCFVDQDFVNGIEKCLDLDSKHPKKTSNVKRTKERKIGYIIEKVNLWRKLYNGFYDESKEFVKETLDNAAKKIGISKKSLDDYLLQLRLGRRYGFDFNKNRNEKVGALRNFVKNKRGDCKETKSEEN